MTSKKRKQPKKVPGIHKCLVCHKTFARRDCLRRHKSVHSNMRGVRCTICGAAYKRMENLKRRIRTIHTVKASTNHPKDHHEGSVISVSNTPLDGSESTNHPTSASPPPEDRPGCSHWQDGNRPTTPPGDRPERSHSSPNTSEDVSKDSVDSN